MGSDKPRVDAGFTIKQKMDWQMADLLMPPVPDQEVLRDYACQEQYFPCGWGTSLLPNNPESFLYFEMLGVSSDAKILAALFFFKALGFIKPEEDNMKVFFTAQSKECQVCVAMGPKGLTRIHFSMGAPRVGIIGDL